MQDPPSRPLHSLDVLAQCKDRVTEYFRGIFRRESLPESVREKDPTTRSDEPGCSRRASSARAAPDADDAVSWPMPLAS